MPPRPASRSTRFSRCGPATARSWLTTFAAATAVGPIPARGTTLSRLYEANTASGPPEFSTRDRSALSNEAIAKVAIHLLEDAQTLRQMMQRDERLFQPQASLLPDPVVMPPLPPVVFVEAAPNQTKVNRTSADPGSMSDSDTRSDDPVMRVLTFHGELSDNPIVVSAVWALIVGTALFLICGICRNFFRRGEVDINPKRLHDEMHEVWL
eukprot:CAMPEP_0175335512 /NCGR_PEP_ID=MMETSP0095-20121207/3335_1 /TAXON_ID=311494 /ORGANISM="Alexandrium monilatum, Strain CCMP3105" /LENGTH=209 /DNA_ID=CAMNT_0016632841 /DNA_START=26 /DNA_END=652 /DNA_ORIENTATION=+